MTKKGRPPRTDVHRRPNGRISQAHGARGDADLIGEQPHRKLFCALLGEGWQNDKRAGTALGRLRLIGIVEERADDGNGVHGRDLVRRLLYGGHRDAPDGPFGISERLYQAGEQWAVCVWRERWVRASPKDKPSAIAFMTARGIDTAVHDLSERQAQNYVRAFNDARAALLSAPCPRDVQRGLRVLRTLARKAPGEICDAMTTMLQGIGAMFVPASSSLVATAVNHVVVDDRDPAEGQLVHVRRGFEALADHFGLDDDAARRPIVGEAAEMDWPHGRLASGRPVPVTLATRGEDGTLTPGAQAGRAPGGWKGRHRSLAGGG